MEEVEHSTAVDLWGHKIGPIKRSLDISIFFDFFFDFFFFLPY